MIDSAQFKRPDENEFEQVKQLVKDFWLDDADMQPGQFGVLSYNGKVIAFGRLREHADATELCTMGVAKDLQGKGLGDKMVKHLQGIAKRNIYLVTVIPDFFKKTGFKITETYPEPLQKKVERCSADFHVGETYHVMKWEFEYSRPTPSL
ncbi:MAG TPA: GNAT family N-acetyltransferase [Bacteroidia bacterium]|nr:GNAT family N-acetyltransferase [Bacteroidia bacterium]